MSEQQINVTVKYDRRVTRKVSTKNPDGSPDYGSHEVSEFASVGIEFPEGLTIDSARELDRRLHLAFLTCRERVMRETEPPTELFTKIRKAFEAAKTTDEVGKLDALMSERFNEGKLERRELLWLEEIAEDCRALLVIPEIDMPDGDGAVVETVTKLKEQLKLKTGDEVAAPKEQEVECEC